MDRNVLWLKECRVNCLLVMFVFVIMSGCGVRTQLPLDRSPIVPFTEPNIILGAGDVVEIIFTHTPEFNVVRTIRPDGKIELIRAGDYMASGKTPLQLHDGLMDVYSKYLVNHEILVVVQSLYSRRVYVNGEVNNPGIVEFSGQMTALDAIVAAGGFNTDTAGPNRVKVIRYENGIQRGFTVNLDKVLDGDESEPFYLLPYDVINVPRSRISSVNYFVDQYVNGMIPQVILSTIPFIVYREYFSNE